MVFGVPGTPVDAAVKRRGGGRQHSPGPAPPSRFREEASVAPTPTPMPAPGPGPGMPLHMLLREEPYDYRNAPPGSQVCMRIVRGMLCMRCLCMHVGVWSAYSRRLIQCKFVYLFIHKQYIQGLCVSSQLLN